jgi:hypothetical protein
LGHGNLESGSHEGHESACRTHDAEGVSRLKNVKLL